MDSETVGLVPISFIRKYLRLSGHWPERKSSFSTKFRSLLSLTSATVFFVTNMAEIFLHFDDFRYFAENMSVTVPVVSIAVKLLIFKSKRGGFLEMLEALVEVEKSHSQGAEHAALVRKTGGDCILLTKIYGGTCAIVVVMYAVLSPRSESGLPIKLDYDFGKWYYAAYIFQMTAIMNAALNTVLLDMLAVCCIAAVTAQLEVLCREIYKISGNGQSEAVERLRNCVVHHSQIIKFLRSVEDIFNLFFLVQYFCSIFSICNIGFQLANIHPLSAQFANMILYFSAMTFQLAIFCWFGNEIIIKSLALTDACYDTNWIQSDKKIQKSLLIIMTRCNRQLVLTAGKYSILSLRSLTTILNATYSYFALMQRLYKKDQH